MPLHEADIPQEDDSSPNEAVHVKSTIECSVKINGIEVAWTVQSFALDQETYEHHSLRVVFSYDIETSDESQMLAKSVEFHDKIGAPINLAVKSKEQYLADLSTPLEFTGIITNIYVRSSAAKMVLVEVEATSPTIKADLAREFRAFKDLTRLDLVNQLLSAYPIEKGTIESPGDSAKAEHIMQWNQSDWDLICHLMSFTDSFVYYDGKKICIEKAKSTNQVALDWLRNVGSIEVRMNAQQIKFKSAGWSNKEKAGVVGQHMSPSTSFTGLAARALSGSNNIATQIDNSLSQTAMGATDARLQASADGNEAVSELVRFHLQSNAPAVRVGCTIKLDGMGSSYNGVYFVTKVRHRADGEGYYNFIEGIPLESAKPKLYSSRYRQKRTDPIPAIVINNKDPEKRGRLKVKFPQASTPDGQPLESGWIRTIAGYAGRGRGIYFMPEVDDEVLVIFEYGDPNNGYVIGSLWNGKDKPNGSVYHDENNFNVIYSRSGHQIILNDTSGDESISIIDKTGKNYIKIGCKDNKIEIVSEKDIVIKAKENIEIEAGKDFKVTTNQGNMTFDAKMNYDVNSMSMSVDAKQSASVKSNGSVDLDGGMVNVQGKGNVAVKGNPIMLN